MRSSIVLLGACAGMCVSAAASASIIDFEGFPAGTVITNQLVPQGIGLVTAIGGANQAMIFDSSNPTGNDPDLGTPNSDFGGPGIGSGGGAGMPGENSIAFGNILIISGDGNASDPDDFAGGGTLAFQLLFVADAIELDLIDIEEAGGTVAFFLNGAPAGPALPIPALGDNSHVAIGASGFEFDEFRVNLVGSGAVAEIYVIPAPAGLAAFLVGGVVACRRRRAL